MATNEANAAGEIIQSLLRGEISAIETYDQVLTKFAGKPQETALAAVRHEHTLAKKRLKSLASRAGEDPDKSSGIWGSWAKLTTGAAKLFGEAAALKALKEGEEHGLKEYEAASNKNEIDSVIRDEISGKFLSTQREHIATLDKLISALH